MQITYFCDQEDPGGLFKVYDSHPNAGIGHHPKMSESLKRNISPSESSWLVPGTYDHDGEPLPLPEEGSFAVTVVWGSDAVSQIGEMSLEELREWGSVGTTVFATEAEMEAYIQGVEDTSGWLEHAVYEGGEDQIPVPSEDDAA